jgi:hypothetical protein
MKLGCGYRKCGVCGEACRGLIFPHNMGHRIPNKRIDSTAVNT